MPLATEVSQGGKLVNHPWFSNAMYWSIILGFCNILFSTLLHPAYVFLISGRCVMWKDKAALQRTCDIAYEWFISGSQSYQGDLGETTHRPRALKLAGYIEEPSIEERTKGTGKREVNRSDWTGLAGRAFAAPRRMLSHVGKGPIGVRVSLLHLTAAVERVCVTTCPQSVRELSVHLAECAQRDPIRLA